GAFHGLSRERSDARRYPAIHPLESWSKYPGSMDPGMVEYGRDVLHRGSEVGQMMKVVGEEGTSLDDYIWYLKGEFTDSVYLQQNAFDPIDAAVNTERQEYCFGILFDLLTSKLNHGTKDEARDWFAQLRQKFLDLNGAEWQGGSFKKLETEIRDTIKEKRAGTEANATDFVG
ncbi:unnamed protein product, partial [marine sediment metagenome]